MPLAPTLTTLADRFDAALALLLLALRHLAPNNPPMAGATARVLRIRAAFARLVRQVADSTLGTTRRGGGASRPRADTPSKPRRGSAADHPIPRTFGWLMGDGVLDPLFQLFFSRLFAHPEMTTLVATSPERATRMLRPLCRMLGITPPAGLFVKSARRVSRAAGFGVAGDGQAAHDETAHDETARDETARDETARDETARDETAVRPGDVTASAAAAAQATAAVPSSGQAAFAAVTEATTNATVQGAPEPAPCMQAQVAASQPSINPETAPGVVSPTPIHTVAAEPPNAELALLRAVERELARPRPPAVTVPSPPPDWALAWRPANVFATERMRSMRVFDVDDWPIEI